MTFSLVGLAMLWPVMLALAGAVALSGPGPVLYRQRRMGRGGVPFTLYKFRTMVPGAEHMLPGLSAPLREEFARTFKLQNDPRATSIGAVLRRCCLDELPQLVNVLRGEMSLVGPRPVLAEELAFYGQAARELLSVRPGLTGYWQVGGRAAAAYDRRREMELFYAKNRGLLLDAKIMLLTVGAVFGRRGGA